MNVHPMNAYQYLRLALAAAAVLAFITGARAQPFNQTNSVTYCQTDSQVDAQGQPIAVPCTAANPLAVTITAVPPGTLPVNSTGITGNGAGTTGAVVGTLAGVANATTYICGFNVSSVGTGAIGPITIAGTLGSSLVYQRTTLATGDTFGQTFTPCIPASAANTPITVTTTADASASAVDVNSWGFQVASTPYPGTSITGNAAGTTGAVVGSLAGAAGKTTYICGFSVSAVGGTAAVGPITIANIITGSMIYRLFSSATGTTVGQTFTPCIPANAQNTAITTTTTADGTASAVNVVSWGFQQ